MRIRIALHYDLAPAGHAPPDLEALGRHAEWAERAGCGIARVAERVTGPGGVPSALPVCAALATRTRRMHVGTAVLPLALHHPLRVAEDAATLDLVSDGRFELGVGLGDDPGSLEGFGVAPGERGARLEEAVALLRAAWRGGPIRFEGRHHRVHGIEVFPLPARAGGPPVWVGAGAAAAQARAARVADGLLLAAGASPEPFLGAWERLGRPAGAAGLAVLLEAADAEAAVREAAAWAARLEKRPALGTLDLMLPVRRFPSERDAALAALRASIE